MIDDEYDIWKRKALFNGGRSSCNLSDQLLAGYALSIPGSFATGF